MATNEKVLLIQIKEHWMTERTSPINVQVSCTCGWVRTISRRQNALARAAKVRAAYREHERELEACDASE